MKKMKVCSIITAALMTMSVTVSSNTISAYAKEESGSLKVQMFNTNTCETTNGAGMQYDIKNTSNESIDLSKVKIRYYYTADNSISENFYCDYAAVITGYIHEGIGNKVNSKFIKLDEPKQGADHYLEISFSSDAGELKPNADVRVQGRFSKQNWTSFSQINDYSFNADATGFVDWDKCAVFIDDELAFGKEPSEDINPETIKSASVSVDMYNVTTSASVNTINPRIKVTNTSDEVVDLSKLKLNYYFTSDGDEKENFYCDYAGITKGSYRSLTGNVKGKIVDFEGKEENIDKKLEISFTEEAGILDPGETMEIHTRLAKENWTNFDQENDYSFNSNAKNYENTDKMTAFIDGKMVSGVKPGDSEEDIDDDKKEDNTEDSDDTNKDNEDNIGDNEDENKDDDNQEENKDEIDEKVDIDSTISSKNLEFNKNDPKEVSTILNLNGNELVEVFTNDSSLLVDGYDYVIENNELKFTEEYLNSLEDGTYTITFNFNKGKEAKLTLNVKDVLKENQLRFTIGNAEGKQGDTIEVPVIVKGLNQYGAEGFDALFKYDSSKFENVSVEPVNIPKPSVTFTATIQPEKNQIKLLFINMDDDESETLFDSGVICKIKMTIKEDAEKGKAVIENTDKGSFAYCPSETEVNSYDVIFENGSVNIQ